MRRSVIAISVLFLVYGCSCVNLYAKDDEAKAEDYSKIEILLSDFSKTITAFYEKEGLLIPKEFDEKEFFTVLEKAYPDQSKVELIKNGFKLKVRPVGDYYSVVLCDPETDNKLMEDFSCDLRGVEVRYWDKEGKFPCTFEEDWTGYCK